MVNLYGDETSLDLWLEQLSMNELPENGRKELHRVTPKFMSTNEETDRKKAEGILFEL